MYFYAFFSYNEWHNRKSKHSYLYINCSMERVKTKGNEIGFSYRKTHGLQTVGFFFYPTLLV